MKLQMLFAHLPVTNIGFLALQNKRILSAATYITINTVEVDERTLSHFDLVNSDIEVQCQVMSTEPIKTIMQVPMYP